MKVRLIEEVGWGIDIKSKTRVRKKRIGWIKIETIKIW
jgi:hypothetical protein